MEGVKNELEKQLKSFLVSSDWEVKKQNKLYNNMTKQELFAFVQNNEESDTLEYKLKPNFNGIKKNIDAIKDRMHFNILKTIYGFANAEGGVLYVGIKDRGCDTKDSENTIRRRIEGLDECDIRIVTKQIWKDIDPKIKKEKKFIELENSRSVMKIIVAKLKPLDKPLFLDGILYIRSGTETKQAKSFKDCEQVYKDKQWYMCLTNGIKSNFKRLMKPEEDFASNQFIEGLKIHMRSIVEKNRMEGYKYLEEAEDLIDQIKEKITVSKNTLQPDLDKLIDDFIKNYKSIVYSL